MTVPLIEPAFVGHPALYDGDRDTVERDSPKAPPDLCFCCTSLEQRTVGNDGDEGVQPEIELFNTAETRFRQLHGRDLFAVLILNESCVADIPRRHAVTRRGQNREGCKFAAESQGRGNHPGWVPISSAFSFMPQSQKTCRPAFCRFCLGLRRSRRPARNHAGAPGLCVQSRARGGQACCWVRD
jgi:hypothetical protein